MARIRTIRRLEGAAASVGVGLVLLLAALVWQRYARSGDDAADDAALAADCEAKLRRDARTVSMTPDAVRQETPAGPPVPGEARAPAATSAASPGAGHDPRGVTGGTSAEPERQLRLTDYGWAARNMHLRNDPCTKYYRRKLALGR